jgi:bifunctional UDP-N-acetylglucosamine pyrophosphorylase/glucosamine-1-phosphate N-acetyltransferase
LYAHQDEQLGTGHAAKIGLEPLNNYSPSLVLIGYGDHMMFYKKETVQQLIDTHVEKKAAITLVTVRHNDPNMLAWGRIIRDTQGNIIKSVEQKDANDDELPVNELNAGFYAFDYAFIRDTIDKVPKSEVSGEYYLNALVEIALADGKHVEGLEAPFSEVGIGVNRAEELEASQKMHESLGKNSE